jgi:hypothetical protein
MADYGTLFLLVLTALTFVLVGMAFIVYLMILSEREKNRLRAQLESFSRIDARLVCPHSFGYLSGYSTNEPVPDECFGCPKAVECMNGHKVKDSDAVVSDESESLR